MKITTQNARFNEIYNDIDSSSLIVLHDSDIDLPISFTLELTNHLQDQAKLSKIIYINATSSNHLINQIKQSGLSEELIRSIEYIQIFSLAEFVELTKELSKEHESDQQFMLVIVENVTKLANGLGDYTEMNDTFTKSILVGFQKNKLFEDHIGF